MPYILFILLILPFQDQKYLISNGTISGVKIGSSQELFVSEMVNHGFSYKLDSIESCIACDEYDSVFYFYDAGTEIFRADPGWTDEDRGTIFRVIVFSPSFKTDKGISVGRTIGDLEKVYGDLEFYMDGHTGIHLFTEDFSGSFGIEVPKVERWFELTLDSLAKTQKINEIIILE